MREAGEVRPPSGPRPWSRSRERADLLRGVVVIQAPPITGGSTTVFVSATPLNDFDTLEARLDARFAALEAQFAVFEACAQNGFGRFVEADEMRQLTDQSPR